MDFATLELLRRTHPAWRLLAADSAPLVASFLHRSFVAPNVRTLARSALIPLLDDYLHALRESLAEGAFPRSAAAYVDEWADGDHGWLRKYYPPGSDEPHFDLAPSTERAIDWLVSLKQRQFVATESRLLTVFELLRQMVQGSEVDPQARLAELERRRAELDLEIERTRAGDIDVLDDTSVRDRFQQMATTARGLLGDFREVEQNFRELDRAVRERVATWEGGKGELLEQVFRERDAIGTSDQGRSFRAFWDFLMSPSRQEELSSLLESVFALDAVRAMAPDPRLLRVHYDWLEAGDVTQRTVARLSGQLRRYLDDQAFLENRRIMGILRRVEQHALALRDVAPEEAFAELPGFGAGIELPFERPLFTPPFKARLSGERVEAAGDDQESAGLYDQIHVDRARLRSHIRRALQTRAQVTLAEVVEAEPLAQGLSELVAYLAIATEPGDMACAVIDEETNQVITWTDPEGATRQATLPRVVFVR